MVPSVDLSLKINFKLMFFNNKSNESPIFRKIFKNFFSVRKFIASKCVMRKIEAFKYEEGTHANFE